MGRVTRVMEEAEIKTRGKRKKTYGDGVSVHVVSFRIALLPEVGYRSAARHRDGVIRLGNDECLEG